MPVQDSYKVREPEAKAFKALEADVYQVEISDITLEENIPDVFNPGKVKDQFTIKLAVLDEHERCAALRVWATAKWFDGGKNATKASKYYQLVTAIDDYYSKGEKNNAVDALSGKKVNSLIGKQMRVTVTKFSKPDGSFRNNVTGFMPIKKEMPAIKPDEVYVMKTDDEEVFPPTEI